ncbi:MAG TPA: hypothetical protein VKS78_11065 [Roseiarcus sp.]|nr:hypothetical protein [Roseiarcus sp.]
MLVSISRQAIDHPNIAIASAIIFIVAGWTWVIHTLAPLFS